MANDNVRGKVRHKWKQIDPSSRDAGIAMWRAYEEEYNEWDSERRATAKKSKYNIKDDLTIQSLVFTYLYPRLDSNVSTGINHLLKSPWCVHPKTGKICVPINYKQAGDFDPARVPTLTMVINQMGQSDAANTKEDGGSITPECLRPYMDTFKTFLRNVEKKGFEDMKAVRATKQDEDVQMDF